MLLMIDNYDSFTWNLVQYLQVLGADVRVERNDALDVDAIARMAPEQIVLSPGPCTPNEAGICLAVIEQLGPRIPVLGVCLGHQAIGQAYGGRVVRAKRIMHGKQDSLPDCLEVTAWTDDADGGREEIMALRHREHPVQGVQFHPESILSQHGHALLRNILEQV
jgi:anthranilate synthase component 2